MKDLNRLLIGVLVAWLACAASARPAYAQEGKVVAWGLNNAGQTTVPPGLRDVVDVSAGSCHGLALKKDGTIVAWGCNEYGQTDVPAGLTGVVAISAGLCHSLALKRNGTVVSWGSGWDATSLDLCTHSGDPYGVKTVPAGLRGVKAIAAGENHNLALKRDGTVVAWGWNDAGQTDVPTGLDNAIGIATGGVHSLALRRNGTVVGWGDNTYEQLDIPAGLSGVTAIAAANVLGAHSLALKYDGTVVAWGSHSMNEWCPILDVPPGLSGVAAIAAGQWHNLALKRDGTVVSWGCAPPLAGLSGVTAVSAGSFFSLAVTTPLDDFDRRSRYLGPDWSGSTFGYRIHQNEVRVDGGGPIFWRDHRMFSRFGVDQEVHVTLTAVDPNGLEQDLLLKVQGGFFGPAWWAGEIRVVYDAVGHSVRVETLRPGLPTWFSYAGAPATFVDGDRFGARALSSGEVQIFQNYGLIATVTLTTDDQAFFNARGGYIGLWFDVAPAARFDDFGGGTLKP